MEEAIYKHQAIVAALNNYPRDQWPRVIAALTIYGMQALEQRYNVPTLSLEQLESLCGIHSYDSLENAGISTFMRELNTIKDELFRLNQRVDQTVQNSYRVSAPLTDRKQYDTYAQAETLIRPYIFRKPSSAWRTSKKKKVRSHSPKHHDLYLPPHVPHKGKRRSDRSKERVSSNRKKATIKRTVPLYLKNVRSRILPNIEKDKLEYNIRQHFETTKKKEAEPEVEEGRDGHLMDIADRYLHNSIINYFTKPRAPMTSSPSEHFSTSQEDAKSDCNQDSPSREEYGANQYGDVYVEAAPESSWKPFSCSIGNRSRSK
eukprot:TRINITY_DN256_c0_g3_i1.p1 TRINITY_DN256_c0_g3~~TRINITY_DN256_c0_g3_i1.p1  ORF type:complete len:317 (+),score=45.51 TRINITY_DN256_c0_g3_i1:117-1067(+)